MSFDPALVVPGLMLLAIVCLGALAVGVVGGFSGAAIVLLILRSRAEKARANRNEAIDPGRWWEELAKSAGPDRENL